MEILNHPKGTSQRQLDFVSMFILILGMNFINKIESS